MAKLKRHITLLPLVLYGIGDILGSGIYGLVGKVAGEVGNLVWLAFLISFGVAAMSGLCYAALTTRYPRAAGSSFIVWKAFRSPLLAFVVGLATLCSGLTSMAAASRIFSGYLTGMVEYIPVGVAIAAFCVLLTSIVFAGIRESLWVNAVCTLIEVAGLLIVIVAGLPFVGQVNILDVQSIPNVDSVSPIMMPSLLFSGAVLAFYSFIGFEDLINVSEEVVRPKRTVPLGLVIAMLVSSVIYMMVGIVAISVVPADQLSQSKQPLVDVVQVAWPWFPTQVFSVIALFAVANTALLNFIMSSRLLYGLANLGLLPIQLAAVHKRTKTPYISIAIVFGVLMALAFLGEVASLARATSIFVLLVFIAMNISLFVFQRRESKTHPRGRRRWRLPQAVPLLGGAGALVMLGHAQSADYAIAGTLLALILILYFVKRPTIEQIEKFEAQG